MIHLQIQHLMLNWNFLALEFVSAVLDSRLPRNDVCKMLRKYECEFKILRIPYLFKLSFYYNSNNDHFILRRIK